MKSEENLSAATRQEAVGKAAAAPGLRERQKQMRHEKIIAAAGKLFKTRGFDDTTIAAIAEQAEVSTPTVFNYFKTKDELLLALVLQVHHETREWVHHFKPRNPDDMAEAIGEFLSTYSRMSLKSINRQTWRHVESTAIRMPESDFVKRYDRLSREMLSDFEQFLAGLLDESKGIDGAVMKTLASIFFNHWGVLFVDLVRDESITIDTHVAQLQQDVSAVIAAIEGGE